MENFENKYHMNSHDFYENFQGGKLGDDADWFDWVYLIEAYNKLVEQRDIIKRLNL